VPSAAIGHLVGIHACPSQESRHGEPAPCKVRPGSGIDAPQTGRTMTGTGRWLKQSGFSG